MMPPNATLRVILLSMSFLQFLTVKSNFLHVSGGKTLPLLRAAFVLSKKKAENNRRTRKKGRFFKRLKNLLRPSTAPASGPNP